MPFPIPFAGVDRRIAWLRATLLIACLAGVLCSVPTWLNDRSFPVQRIVSWFPVLPSPWDKVFFGVMLLTLVAAAWFYRPAVSIFLGLSLFAFCEDGNRGQPWFYMYWVMLLLTLFPQATALAACRFAMSGAYLWSGIQKCNSGFGGVPDWFTAPASSHWHLPKVVIDLLQGITAATPFIEIGIGLALWISMTRWVAVGAVVVLHCATLLFLGPLGHNFNQVIWPWNGAMIALVLVLFWQRNPATPASKRKRAPQKVAGPGLAEAWTGLRRSKAALLIVMLYVTLPILSYGGWWDSYFSFCLYSGNTANANVFVTPALKERLPARLQAYVQPFRPDYDPQHQGPLLLNFNAWAYDEMHVPPIPEVRNFRSIFNALRAYSKEAADVRMIAAPRSGWVIFWEADRTELLMPMRTP